jgi:4-hydroxybenzoate polyprenyltransferase
VLAAWRLNPLALALSPVALAILFLYSYTKRFTWASHLQIRPVRSHQLLEALVVVAERHRDQ